VRVNVRATACIVLLLGLAAAYGKPASARSGQELLPEQSAAKAKQVLQQTIAALGGQAFLDVRETDCEGRIAQFGSNGDLMGYTPFHDLWLLPDKNRTEYITKGQNTIAGFLLGADGLAITHGGVLITVYSGEEGWMLDKGGVTNQPDDLVKTFTEQVKTGMNNMLRLRMNERSVEFNYAGPDLIDMKEADWIEFTDSAHRSMRLAADKSTHLPLRWVVETRDPETRERTDNTIAYTQYISMDGVKTPLNLVRSHNGRNVSQTFLSSCKYNSSLAPDLFTRASLDHIAPEVMKKGYKDNKNSK
jgi:hypothetical protein